MKLRELGERAKGRERRGRKEVERAKGRERRGRKEVERAKNLLISLSDYTGYQGFLNNGLTKFEVSLRKDIVNPIHFNRRAFFTHNFLCLNVNLISLMK